ncbi:MAG: hypothetical protein HUJ26_14630 [Planctomycetaceae bacterium]|nr:hypothetical protein [Planctomycetaceae bacterium]
MNIDAQAIDDIVAGVLSQLGMTSTVARAPRSSTTIQKPQSGQQPLRLSEIVITEELLSEKAVSAESLLIIQGAVITPSGRDWLRKHDVTWKRVNEAVTSAEKALWRLIVATPSEAIDKLNDEVTRWGWSVDCVSGSEEAAVCGVTSLNEQTEGVVILTAEPERVACRANRHSHVRAASVAQVADITRVKQQLGVNLIAVCPGDRGFFELRNMMKTLAAGGPPQAPENW